MTEPRRSEPVPTVTTMTTFTPQFIGVLLLDPETGARGVAMFQNAPLANDALPTLIGAEVTVYPVTSKIAVACHDEHVGPVNALASHLAGTTIRGTAVLIGHDEAFTCLHSVPLRPADLPAMHPAELP